VLTDDIKDITRDGTSTINDLYHTAPPGARYLIARPEHRLHEFWVLDLCAASVWLEDYYRPVRDCPYQAFLTLDAAIAYARMSYGDP
jgi:hypothetical protein